MAAVAISPISKVSQNVRPEDPPRFVVVWKVVVSEKLMMGDGGLSTRCGGPEMVSPHLSPSSG